MGDKSSKYQQALQIQKEIAETLNKRTNLNEMLQLTLERLLNLMDLETGWIFLIDDESSYQLAADYQLPPAMADNREELMGCDHGYTDCACMQLYWEGYMEQAVNHVKCVRLEEAISNDMGETHGLTHHASIPLTIRGKKIGLLNLASSGRKFFQGDELLLLETVAYQIGAAIERTRLYLERTKEEVYSITRYIVNTYENAEKINRQIANIFSTKELFGEIIQQVYAHMPSWDYSAIITDEQRRLTVQANSNYETSGETFDFEQDANFDQPDIIRQAYVSKSIRQATEKPLHFTSLKQHEALHSIALPLVSCEKDDETYGVLLLSRTTSPCDNLEIGMLEVLTGHISMVIERIYLHEEWEKLLVEQERNRVARDLHDSVKQKLFALSLTSRGLHEMVGEKSDLITDALQDLQTLSREALTDMHSLIWQLRPYDPEQGLTSSLHDYAQKIGVDLSIETSGEIELKRTSEEALWRVGQEALNNIKKHAETTRATIMIQSRPGYFMMKIIDQGIGGVRENQQSLGVKSMRERIEELRGELKIESEKNKGTIITVTLPIDER